MILLICLAAILIAAPSRGLVLVHIKATRSFIKSRWHCTIREREKINVLPSNINRLLKFGGECKRHVITETLDE